MYKIKSPSEFLLAESIPSPAIGYLDRSCIAMLAVSSTFFRATLAEKMAADFYEKAKVARPDMKGYYFQKLHDFLTKGNYLETKWAQFYLGDYYLKYGSNSQAFTYYCNVMCDDYRAACAVIRIMNLPDSKDLKDQVKITAGVIAVLEKAVEMNHPEAMVAMGQLCAFGVEQKREEAFAWYAKALNSSVCSPVLRERTIRCLTSWFMEDPLAEDGWYSAYVMAYNEPYFKDNDKVRGELAYHIGYMNTYNANTVSRRWGYFELEAVKWYTDGVKHSCVSAACALAKEYMRSRNVAGADKVIADALKWEHLTPVDRTNLINAKTDTGKDAFHRGSINSIELHCLYKRLPFDEDWQFVTTWYENPNALWWLQACQACPLDKDDLHRYLPMYETKFGSCLQAFQCAIGTYNNPPNLDKARALVQKIDPELLKQYIEAGKEENLYNVEMAAIFKDMQPKTNHQPSATVASPKR